MKSTISISHLSIPCDICFSRTDYLRSFFSRTVAHHMSVKLGEQDRHQGGHSVTKTIHVCVQHACIRMRWQRVSDRLGDVIRNVYCGGTLIYIFPPLSLGTQIGMALCLLWFVAQTQLSIHLSLYPPPPLLTTISLDEKQHKYFSTFDSLWDI